MYKLTKLLNNGDERTIDIIESIGQTAFEPIVAFDYTCVMNWIAHDSIVILYPNFTLKKLGVDKSRKGDGERVRSRLKKYEERGFVHRRQTIDLPGAPACKEACLRLSRNTHDGDVMVVSLVEGGHAAMHSTMPRVSWGFDNMDNMDRFILDSDDGTGCTYECQDPRCPGTRRWQSTLRQQEDDNSLLQTLHRVSAW